MVQIFKFTINGVFLGFMKHRKPEFRIYTFGEYSSWDQLSKEMPRIRKIASELVAFAGMEFGYVLHIRKGKGEKLTFEITHPPFRNPDGSIVPPFSGEHYISTNDYMFFLGDSITDPVEDKRGEWEFATFHRGKMVAHKKLILV